MKKPTTLRAALYTGVACLIGLPTLTVDVTAQTGDALMDALVRKGVLTEQEAREIKAEVEKEKAGAGNSLNFAWKDGIAIQSADKETFTGKISGRIHLDGAAFDPDADVEALAGDMSSGAEIRRARIGLEGEIKLSTPTFYKVEVDFGGSEVSLKDVFIGIGELPYLGSFQAGHFKEPISLDILTSSRFIPFMERSAAVETFAPERNTGFMFQNAILDQRMTWALGAFTDTEDGDSMDVANNYRVSGRITGLPYWDDEANGTRLVHLGLSGSYIEPSEGMMRFRSRPEAHLAPRFVDTDEFAADQSYLMGAELAAVFGPFSVQGEYFRNWVCLPGGNDASFHGYYILGSYFLTGEHRVYKKSSGAFDRVRPKRNFSIPDGGAGAWEVLARYSRVDLNDSGIMGGELCDFTGGLNWYLNPNTRMMFNYVFANVERDDVEGDAHIFQTRLAIDF